MTLLPCYAKAQSLTALTCLSKAYPEFLSAPTEAHFIFGREAKQYPYRPSAVYKDRDDELNHADLYSQLRQKYRTGSLETSPEPDDDPGRFRHMPLFLDMYGRSSSEVALNLVTINWAPCNCKLQFSSVNGASRALEMVGHQIHQEGLSRYVDQSIGTFNWRKIAGTNRLSMHALGIAIDFKLPAPLGRYWRWDRTASKKTSTYPKEIMMDEGFNRIVTIFESYGFIWGGKWWHYDSIHFEFRPELALYGCNSDDGDSEEISNQK